MPEEISLNMSIPRGHLFLLLMISALICGLLVGYMVGGYGVDKRWNEYVLLREAQIERDCICIVQEEFNSWTNPQLP